MEPKIRVLLADDHQIVRAGLARYITSQTDMEVVGEASTGDEVISMIRKQAFDVVLMDLSMPKKNGIDTLRVLRQSYPALPILIVSGFAESHYAIKMIRVGANGYIAKDADPAEIIRAIRVVAQGKRYLTETTAELISMELTRSEKSPKQLHEGLSSREFQIFHKLATGRSGTQIGEELNISPKTVSTYRARILIKMQMKTNAQLTCYAVEHDLVS